MYLLIHRILHSLNWRLYLNADFVANEYFDGVCVCVCVCACVCVCMRERERERERERGFSFSV